MILVTALILVLNALTVMPLPRQDCESIRGTQYLYDSERDYYLANCVGLPVVYDGAIPDILVAIRFCESRHDYTAVNPNGYYGAYQFDLPTWYSVGGSGYPHYASVEEQDLRALILYQQRGIDPWKGCVN